MSFFFKLTGAVTAIPYATIMPKRCQKPGFIGSWPIAEANGLIYAWYHPQKAASLWQPDAAPETIAVLFAKKDIPTPLFF